MPESPSSDRRVLVQGQPADAYPDLAPESARGRVRRVTVVGEDILHRPCQPVTEFGTPELAQLIDDLFITMYVAEGAGLAANQVDVDLRLFVYDCPDDDGVRHVGHLINPVLDPPDPERRRLAEADEGCLSVPGPRHALYREEATVARGFSLTGEPLVIEGTGFFARCLQHETDHLNGTLYIDRLSKRERRSVLDEMAGVMDEVFAERQERARKLGARDISAAG